MELYLIRHGESFNNALEDVTQRVCDPPLTEKGQAQAQRVGKHLKEASADPEQMTPAGAFQNRSGYRITRIFCSAMLRTMQTAAPIGKALGIHPEVCIDIHEQGGIWLDHDDGRGPVGYPGLTRAEAGAQFPNYILPRGMTEAGWWNRPQEIEAEWLDRAARVAVRLRERFAGTDERIAMVSHGGFGNHLIQALVNGGKVDGIYFAHQNTSISRLDFHGNGHIVVVYTNRLEHLPVELVT